MTTEEIKTICECISHIVSDITVATFFSIAAYSFFKWLGGGFENDY